MKLPFLFCLILTNLVLPSQLIYYTCGLFTLLLFGAAIIQGDFRLSLRYISVQKHLQPGEAQETEELSLVPSLLPEIRPASKLNHVWPPVKGNFFSLLHIIIYAHFLNWPSTIIAGEKESQFGRHYKFDFIPKGFFGRLMIRLLAFPLQAKIYWRFGMLAKMGREKILIGMAA